jgi:serine/threonine-protein kinase
MEADQTVAGKYRLSRLLGTGGMASVWSATNVFTERQFAIKFMLPQVARTPESARRFLLEAKVSARINHPNIIEVIDVGQAEDGSLFLVMELLTGVSLESAVRERTPPMAMKEFLGVMKEVAEALAAAHRSGVVHRDLKPSNIFLHTDRDGRVVPKLLDFGVSKILEEENSTSLTQVGTVLGSPMYMSPEQAMGAAGIDGRTDVFAFGSILFESLTGERPYGAPNFNALIVTIATKQPKSIDEVAPDLPPPLRALVRDCLVTDKERRIANFELVVERLTALAPVLAEVDLRLPSHPSSPPSSDPEATNALPKARTGDSSAPKASTSQPSPSSLPPAGPSPLVMQITTPSAHASQPPSAAPHGWQQRAIAFVRGLPPLVLAAGGGATALLVVLIVGVSAIFRHGVDSTPSGKSGADPAAAQASSFAASAPVVAAPSAPTIAPPAADAGASSSVAAGDSSHVPVISVDSLPVAPRGSASKGSGRLSIAASPGHCAVSIDGVARGATPLAAFEVSAGTHRVECVTAAGKARTASVSVSEGAATHYKFSLDE